MQPVSISVDPGSMLFPVFSHGTHATTAVEKDGLWVAPPDRAQGAALIIAWEATLTDAITFSLAANAQDATDGAGAGAADFEATALLGADGAGLRTLVATVVATASGAQVINGVTVVRFPDIRLHRGFMRSQVTGTRSGTTSFDFSSAWIFGGTETLPTAGAVLSHTFITSTT